MNIEIPRAIGEAKVILYSPIDQRHKATGVCNHEISGGQMKKAKCAAICQYENGHGFYLFICYESEQMSDTYHENLEEAKEQAEFEYEGISNTWIKST